MKSAKSAAVLGLKTSQENITFDEATTKTLFDAKCSECHETSDVDKHPPKSAAESRSLIVRMVENGLKCDEKEIAALDWYLNKHYVTN